MIFLKQSASNQESHILLNFPSSVRIDYFHVVANYAGNCFFHSRTIHKRKTVFLAEQENVSWQETDSGQENDSGQESDSGQEKGAGQQEKGAGQQENGSWQENDSEHLHFWSSRPHAARARLPQVLAFHCSVALFGTQHQSGHGLTVEAARPSQTQSSLRCQARSCHQGLMPPKRRINKTAKKNKAANSLIRQCRRPTRKFRLFD